MNTTIMMIVDMPAWGDPALCAMASGIKPFMHSPLEKEPGFASGARLLSAGPGREGAALCHSVRRRLPRWIPGPKVAGKGRKTPLRDGHPEGPHEVQVEVQVVDGVEPRTEDFIATVEV